MSRSKTFLKKKTMRRLKKNKGGKQKRQRKQTKQRRTRRNRKNIRGGGTNPFSEVSSFPSVVGGEIQKTMDIISGNKTPEYQHISALATDQPHLK
tara:strand:- start:292 stop:576 length:285 start_codon:yes stop_codon:yes gene_type:complete